MMIFKCQEDSFLKEYNTKVVSSESGTINWTAPGEKTAQKLSGFHVICEDTILFPEGGGQPCDYGTIEGEPVRSVVRKGDQAIHFVETQRKFEKGALVKQCLDWNRRLDHMQQHSGQHLITSLFYREFNYETTSWSLGTSIANIKLNISHQISRESLDLIERKANELIREGRDVTVLCVDPQVASEFKDVRAPRGLPKDHEGMVRVVCIEGMESNMCCGTHVTNTSQLQCVKLLYAEESKSGVLVTFVVGERVIRKLGSCFQRELQLNLALKGGPLQHLELVEKLQDNVKTSRKVLEKLLITMANDAVESLKNLGPTYPKYFTLHRKIGIEPIFINTFLRNAPEDIFYFITVSENIPIGGTGHMVLRGDPALIQKYAPIFLNLLDGKGNARKNNLQAKINNVHKINECVNLLHNHFYPKKETNTEQVPVVKQND